MDPNQRSLPELLIPATEWNADATATSVRYESQGCLLIIGASGRIVEVLDSFENQLHTIVLLTDAASVASLPQGLVCLRGQLLELSGYLGRFNAVIQGEKDPLNLGLLCPNNKACFDLVLDLSSPPHLSMEVPPLGYYAPGNDPHALKRALQELPELVGTFVKAKFFNYNLSKCVHARKGIQGCLRCIQACPTHAIASLQDRIQIDPHLCQGCGTCAAVCPTGAIRDHQTAHEVLLDDLHKRIRSRIEEDGGRRPYVLFHDTGKRQTLNEVLPLDLPPHFITVRVRELAVAGMETWLNALASGAAGVVLLTTKKLPDLTRMELQRQLATLGKLLEVMGYTRERVRMVEFNDLSELQNAFGFECPDPTINAATFHAFHDKRKIVQKSLIHLCTQVDAPESAITLKAGAPFGEIRVDPDACTLCMSCTTVCPTKALRSGGQQAAPTLEFVETHCVQCGICSQACPENAITLAPRYLFDQERREHARVLKEEPAFHCISCGKPFTTQAIVERMTERLKDNPFFQGEALKKLKQCPDCRSHAHILGGISHHTPSTKS